MNSNPEFRVGLGFSRDERYNTFRIWIDSNMQDQSYVGTQLDVFGGKELMDDPVFDARVDIIECYAFCKPKQKSRFFEKSLAMEHEFDKLNFKPQNKDLELNLNNTCNLYT